MYNALLTKLCTDKKNKRLKTDSEFLELKKSLKEAIGIHMKEVKRLRKMESGGGDEEGEKETR